ncbi:MAG: DUF58 domain-containing protein [Pseudomonadota bacterium]
MPNLTPLSYLFIALIALFGIVGQWAETGVPWWRLAAAAYLGGLFYEWTRVRAVRPSARLNSRAELRLGQRSAIELALSHNAPMPQPVQWAFAAPALVTASRSVQRAVLEPARETTLKLPATAVELGEAALNDVSLRLLGPLGLGWWRQQAPLPGQLSVVPDTLSRGALAFALDRVGEVSRRRIGVGQELYQLRAYQPGDPRHHIDWKATARSGDLMTRVFAEAQLLEVMVVLDVGRTSRNQLDGLSQLGHYVNLAARLAEHAVACGDRIGLVAVSDRPVTLVPPGHDQNTLLRIRRALGALRSEPLESDMLAAAREMSRVVRHRCLVIVLTDLFGIDASGRLTQAIRLWVPQHLPVIVGLTGAELTALTSQAADDWLDPYVSLAAEDYRLNLSRGMEGLRALGAETLSSRPEALEDNLFRRYQQLKARRRV